MGRIYAQSTGSAWNFSGSIATSSSANSGVFNTQGYQRLIGAVYSSASLTTGCGLQISQSIDGGSNWDIVNKYAPTAVGASTYDIEIIGNRMLISASPGGTDLTAFRALFYLQPIGAGTVALKTSTSSIGTISVTAASVTSAPWKTVYAASGTLNGSDAGIGATISGCTDVTGFGRFTGILYLSASLAAASGLTVRQSGNSGTNWDIYSACNTYAAGTSSFSYEIVGNAVRIDLTAGSSAVNYRTYWFARQGQ